jgi:hypothetical protein
LLRAATIGAGQLVDLVGLPPFDKGVRLVTTNSPERAGLWARWALATTVGGTLTGVLEGGGLQFLATLILTGLLVGLAQGLVLPARLGGAVPWIAASALGWVVGKIAQVALSGPLAALSRALAPIGLWGVFWLNTLGEPISGAVLGAAQALILWRAIGGAGWWVAASAVGGMLQGAFGSTVCAAACAPLALVGGDALATGVAYGAGWAAYGVLTGVVLGWLLGRKPTT